MVQVSRQFKSLHSTVPRLFPRRSHAETKGKLWNHISAVDGVDKAMWPKLSSGTGRVSVIKKKNQSRWSELFRILRHNDDELPGALQSLRAIQSIMK